MVQELESAYRELKQDYLALERIHQAERECLFKAMSVLGAAARCDVEEGLHALKTLINTEEPLQLDLIEKETAKLRERIISQEIEFQGREDRDSELLNLKERVLEACRTAKKIAVPLLEGFYPLTEELASKAAAIRIDCRDELEKNRLGAASEEIVLFIESLKAKISQDFKENTGAFFTLLEEVKSLERTLKAEYGGDAPIKQIESFEMKVNREVGSIADSFDVHAAVSEIKSAVIQKIENIRRLVALKKKEEMEKTKAAQENISRLERRIVQAEKDALKMSRRAQSLQTAAMKDGLTNLYNRKAFDLRLREALDGFGKGGDAFSLLLFDLDGFKEINDGFGHVAGDKVLVKVAQCLQDAFRRNDFIARFGGDEFVVLVENLTEESAGERILAFRKNLKKIRFVSYAKGDIEIAVSAGLATSEKDDTPESLVNRADKMMYAVKAGKKRRP